ncbi:MAG: hypothetical protein KKH88_00135 [Nanoarchaeota archaeon]|nr:hypothetical protein [Nanoarchaeota archaeon]
MVKQEQIPTLYVSEERLKQIVSTECRYLTTTGDIELAPGEYDLMAEGQEPARVEIKPQRDTPYKSIEDIVETSEIEVSELLPGTGTQEAIEYYHNIKITGYQARMEFRGLNLYRVTYKTPEEELAEEERLQGFKLTGSRLRTDEETKKLKKKAKKLLKILKQSKS